MVHRFRVRMDLLVLCLVVLLQKLDPQPLLLVVAKDLTVLVVMVLVVRMVWLVQALVERPVLVAQQALLVSAVLDSLVCLDKALADNLELLARVLLHKQLVCSVVMSVRIALVRLRRCPALVLEQLPAV